MDNFEDEDLRNDSEIEFSDLPPGRFSELARTFTKVSARLAPRKRLWRLVMAGSTMFLVLMLVLGALPSAHDQAYRLFVHPTATSTSADTSKEDSYRIEITRIGSNSTVLPQATVAWWNTDAPLGVAPAAGSCQASPVHSTSQEIGSSPAWVVGFDGPGATLRFSPIPLPVSAFPKKFGWAAAITLEIESDYTGLITLSGANQGDGSPLVFGFGLDPSQEQLFSLKLDTQQPAISSNFSPTFKTRRTAWNITIYIPAAGCYFLRATWPGSSWTINFAAGQ